MKHGYRDNARASTYARRHARTRFSLRVTLTLRGVLGRSFAFSLNVRVIGKTGEIGWIRRWGGCSVRVGSEGFCEAVTMTTVIGEVLVRIRDHAYVTTP